MVWARLQSLPFRLGKEGLFTVDFMTEPPAPGGRMGPLAESRAVTPASSRPRPGSRFGCVGVYSRAHDASTSEVAPVAAHFGVERGD